MDNVEEILAGLSQEERLKLLESLIQGATKAREESLSVEERLERLEQIVLAGQLGRAPQPRVVRIKCIPGGSPHLGRDSDFYCCN